MKQRQPLSIFSLTLTLWTITLALTSVTSSTYQLTYDIGLSHDTCRTYHIQSTDLPVNASELGPRVQWSLAKETVSSLLLQLETFTKPKKTKMTSHGHSNPRCIPHKDDQGEEKAMTCLGSHMTATFVAHVSVKVSRIMDQFHAKDYPLVISVDATVTSTHARSLLIQSVSVLDELTDSNSNSTYSSFWRIEERVPPWTPPSVHEHAASLETMILKDVTKEKRVPIHTDVPSIDVWQYESPTDHPPNDKVRALFVNSTLRATTSLSGVIHTEAMIHPAIMAHPYPVHVLVLSEVPTPYARELMKYDSIEHVTLVGAIPKVASVLNDHMNELHDCGLMLDLQNDPKISTSCLQNPDYVELIEDDVTTWLSKLNTTNASNPNHTLLFDVIVLDVSSNTQHWLTYEFHQQLEYILTNDSVVVINYGTTPSLHHQSNANHELRDLFLTQMEQTPDLYEKITVYEEPLAAPFHTTFLLAFVDVIESYYRFFRRSSTAFDLDLLHGVSPQSTNSPTCYFDGITQLSYTQPTRDWENHYCHTHPNYPICNIFLPQWYNSSNHFHHTEVRPHPIKRRSLHVTQPVSQGSFMLSNDAANSIRIDAHQWEQLEIFLNTFPDAHMYHSLKDCIVAYGFLMNVDGSNGWTVSIGSNNTFTNHACTVEEQTVIPIPYPYVNDHNESIDPVFSPLLVRRSEVMGHLVMATRDLNVGEEIAMDYHPFQYEGNVEFDAFLSEICQTGEGLVSIDGKGLASMDGEL